MHMKPNSIDVARVSFSYGGEDILRDIVFSAGEKEFIGVIGPNGAGKTTFLKLLVGLLEPSRGTVRLFGTPPRGAGAVIGYVPQHPAQDLSFPITVQQVVLMGLLSRARYGRRYTAADRGRADEALTVVGLPDAGSRQLRELSGGQRQRVLLARALVSGPRLLLLDEPLAGVDLCAETGFYELLNTLKKSMTILMVSHDVGVVSRHVDRIICLNRTLVCHDSAEEALKNLDALYGCPVDIIAHGVPHRVLGDHDHDLEHGQGGG